MREISNWRESDAFSEVEKLAIEYAELMTSTPPEIPDELVARLREHFDEAGLVELTAAIAWENYLGRFNRALGIEPQGFAEEGAYCLLPDRGASGPG
jgi:alkylhydroperoxidase family enzyme